LEKYPDEQNSSLQVALVVVTVLVVVVVGKLSLPLVQGMY